MRSRIRVVTAAISSTEPLRTLLVAYAFPPVGGVGVQRAAKLCKYLPQYGVHTEVLSVANPSVPLTDERLLDELPRDIPIHRARTLEPGYQAKQATWNASARERRGWLSKSRASLVRLGKNLLVPDPQVLWLPGAGFEATRRLRRDPGFHVALITAPPFSQFLLSPLLKRVAKLPVVLDYRDEWSTLKENYEMLEGQLGRYASAAMERQLLGQATLVTCATEEFKANLLRRFPELPSDKLIAIPNGYDPDDLPKERPVPPTDRLVITYAGTLFRLNSVQGLIAAIRLLWNESPELAKLLEFRFFGRIVETEVRHFEGTEALGIRRSAFLPHDRVLPELLKGHLTLCCLDDVPGTERIYPGKIFELMMLGRRVLTLAPSGALTRLVQSTGLGDVLPPRDTRRIADYLKRELTDFAQGQVSARQPDPGADLSAFHRREIARRFADVLRRASREPSKAPTSHTR